MRQYELFIGPIVGWIIAQGLKFATSLRKDGFQFGDLFQSGGFPSSHTAFVAPLVVLSGLREGADSSLFAVSLVLISVVIYDAMGVRRSSGEHGDAIKELAAKTGKNLTTKMHVSRGHSPVEVMGGLMVGILVGFGFYFLG